MDNKNIVTWKIKYTCNDNFKDYIIQYNNVLRFTYNRIYENKELKTKEITKLQKSINNQNLMNSHLLNSCIYDCKTLIKDQEDSKQVIFGGKKLFIDRCQDKITKEEFKEKRLRPLYSVGETSNKGNRLFKIIDVNTILFKPDRKHYYTLNLQEVGVKRSKEIKKLIELQNNKTLPITYKLDLNYVYISFDYNYLKTYKYKVKQNRVMAIDLNPNYIGWSVVDWKSENKYNIVSCDSYSLKTLNDYQKYLELSSDSKENQYINNKRRHEIIEIAKALFALCKHYKCEVFVIEDLKIINKNHGKGSYYNRLINNQWCRNLLINQLKKHLNSSSTMLLEVVPNYSSFIGNLLYRKEKLPDYILSSIEMGRRGYEFFNQYITQRLPVQTNIVYPNLDESMNSLTISLEEIGMNVSDSRLVRALSYESKFKVWKTLYSLVTKSGVKYRFSLEDSIKNYTSSLFSKFYKQKFMEVYTFI